MSTAIQALCDRLAAEWAPPRRRTVSQFADDEIIVSAGPLKGTRWRTDFAAYQRAVMNAVHEPGVKFVVVMAASQTLKTAVALNVAAFFIAEDPTAILVVQPTVDPMAKDFSRNRLEPMIEASPSLRAKLGGPRSKDGTNATLSKSYEGGEIDITGANSAAGLAARTKRLLILDEVERYEREIDEEGDPIEIAIARTKTYGDRARVLLLSSPKLVDGAIHAWYKRGDERKYFIPCPHCDHLHVLAWVHVKWDTDEHGKGVASTARFVCPSCRGAFGDAEKIASVGRAEAAGGGWRPTRPCPYCGAVEIARSLATGTYVCGACHSTFGDASVISFAVWEAYSPLATLRDIVAGFLRAKEAKDHGDRAPMQTWQNTRLGEPREAIAGDGVEPHVLLMRRERYTADVPESVCALTLGLDTQDDRLEYLVLGWGLGEECWVIDRGILPGDPSQPDVWRQCERLLEATYAHALGPRVPILASAIDTAGHRTDHVYAYVYPRQARRLFAIIGRDGQRPIVSSPSPRRWGQGEREVPLFTVGVDTAKALLVSRMQLTEQGPGYLHLPHRDLIDEEFCAQLTSERLVVRWERGVRSESWKKTRPRNEALDCAIYALAAFRLLNPRLEDLRTRLLEHVATPTPAPAAVAGRRFSVSSYLTGGQP